MEDFSKICLVRKNHVFGKLLAVDVRRWLRGLMDFFSHYGGDDDIEGDSSVVSISTHKEEEPEAFGLVGYGYDYKEETMPHNSSGDSLVSDQKRREYVGDDFSDDSVGMGLDNAPSPSNFVRSPKNNDVHMSDESDTTPTTPTTPTSGTLFLSKTNFSSWRDDYPLDGAQVSPILLEKVQKFTMLRRTGGDINRDLKKQKGFKNPHLLERLIQTNGLYETGSNFRKEIYNPKQWQESSFFDSLSKEQGKLLDEEKKKQEKEQLRKENEKKRPPQHRDDNRSNKRYK